MTTHFETILEQIEKIAALSTAYVEGLDGVKSFRDGNLSQAGLNTKRAELAKTCSDNTLGWVNHHRAAVNSAAVLAERAYEAARPKVDTSSVASLAEVQQNWQFNVLPSLEAGKTLKQVVRDGDVGTLLAAERFGPSYMKLVEFKGKDQASGRSMPRNPLEFDLRHDPEEMQNSINNRMVVVAPPEVVETIREGVLARAATERFNDLASRVENAANGRRDPRSVEMEVRGRASVGFDVPAPSDDATGESE